VRRFQQVLPPFFFRLKSHSPFLREWMEMAQFTVYDIQRDILFEAIDGFL
jgi:hypothetical protein